ncbi:other/SCY1 protein kinase [Crepidotus variabilis]|uniref:Other/SCY1 protein kinase n=1 Tax=Crepidotus variabilis TaxID=179855 RepID=A0A9P6EP16_9AGAR|nr:other/SCY1 protein kinase [Crepidotus variabilis]
MDSVFAAASSLFARTNISQSYSIGSPSQGLPGLGGSRPTTPGSNKTLVTPAAATPPFFVGLWKVQSAWHKSNGKRVSVWSFDKKGPDVERLTQSAKDRVLEVLKAEASSLGRLRHPSILEMVEPLEETRSELVFATEPVLSSLDLSIPESGRRVSLVELDEIEIQKGILQICKGLVFLHNSARLIHSNLSPESIIINGAGDWKLLGLGLTIPLQTNGNPTRWEFPTFDGRVPAYIQRSFDYMAPEYALDEQLVTASDMYSIGCLVYAVHKKGEVPFKNHGSLGGLRENAGKLVPGLERLDPDLQALLKSLITRHYGSRPTPETLPSHPFFSSLPISTLNFLDRSNFTAKTREEKISFMKGLAGVLDKFSEGLRTRKILPSLLEEMKDTNLLPYILPNVFAISKSLSANQFASQVLPSLKPLFAVRDPPQNMLTLLDNLTMLQEKTDNNVFREHVLPLVYNALESEHAIVQERALKTVPGLCDTIDFAEVQNVMFPRVAMVFGKTRILSVKVATLETFLAMVKTLDQLSLTQKMVPLLSKIRTKEPAVMMATLSVQEAMGSKVDREAVATLVLPQLWAMSMGPLLSVNQFQRFMSVIKKLGDRVEREHDQFLRDSQRHEDKSGLAVNGTNESNPAQSGLDFENLVGRSNSQPTFPASNNAVAKPEPNGGTHNTVSSWDDDVWGSIFNEASSTSAPTSSVSSPVVPPLQLSQNPSPSMNTSSRQNSFQPRPSKLTASSPPISSRSHASSSPFPNLSTTNRSTSLSQSSFPSPPPAPRMSTVPLQAKPASPSFSPPNYNLNISSTPTSAPVSIFSTPMNPSAMAPMAPLAPQQLVPNPPMMGGLMTPSRPAQTSKPNGLYNKDDWASFDPLA